MKKRSEVGGQSKVECFDVFPYSSVARCCSVSTYSSRESRPSRYVLWRKLPIRIYLPLRDRGKGNRSLTNTPRSINLDLLIFPGDIPSSRFSRHDLFECYSRNDISSFLRPSTGKASNSGSRTWTLKSWQTREERRRGTSVSTTCRIGRLPSDPYVQPVTCYQSRFRTICPLLPRFPHSSLSSRPSSSELNSNLPRFAQSQPDRSSDCERLIRANERTMGWSFSSVFKCDTTQGIIETPFYTPRGKKISTKWLSPTIQTRLNYLIPSPEFQDHRVSERTGSGLGAVVFSATCHPVRVLRGAFIFGRRKRGGREKKATGRSEELQRRTSKGPPRYFISACLHHTSYTSRKERSLLLNLCCSWNTG